MSVDSYRQQVSRITEDISRSEAKIATAQERAAREREAAMRDESSASRTTSRTTADSYSRSAQRHQERAIQYDKEAAQAQAQVSGKRRSLSTVQRDLANAETRESRRASQHRSGLRALEPEYRLLDLGAQATTTQPDRMASGESRIQVAKWDEDTMVDAALEIGRAGVLGALGSIPLLGPVFSEIAATAWGSNRMDRAIRFAEHLGRDVEALQDRMDAEFVRHADFEALAEDVLDRVVQRKNATKGRDFAAAIARGATFDRPEQRARDRYVDWLDQLRPHQLELLRRLAEPDPLWTRPVDALSVGQVVQSRIANLVAEIGTDQYDWNELERRGLVRSTANDVTLLSAASDHRALVTEAGKAFLNFVETPAAPPLA